MAWLAIGLFLLHIIGALRHQWLLGKPELQRMIPFARGKAVGAAIGALALVVGAFVAGQTVYPERGQPVVEKASPTPAAAPVAPPAAPAAPATEEDEAPAEEAAKEAPVEAKEPLADWTVDRKSTRLNSSH